MGEQKAKWKEGGTQIHSGWSNNKLMNHAIMSDDNKNEIFLRNELLTATRNRNNMNSKTTICHFGLSKLSRSTRRSRRGNLSPKKRKTRTSKKNKNDSASKECTTYFFI